ncbi:hypothetical protein EDB85DRAFT_2289267 [Lactarius pseudohatsudake]|nr:hypothetical protein EDB85DRAFT_2289267 [Lactarius pseudohatsudake]
MQASSSTPNFQPIFENALKEYKKKTGKDLTAHPLAAEINDCDSPESILIVLQGKANELNQSRSSDDRLTKWLIPTVDTLSALPLPVFPHVSLQAFPPTKIIFSGIGIFLVAGKSTVTSRDVLVELFDRIESLFRHLKTYTEVPATRAVMDVLVKIMVEFLSILAIATKGVKERRTKTILKKLAGMNDIDDALQRFRRLEEGELLTVVAQVLRETKGDAKQIDGIAKETVKIMDAPDATPSFDERVPSPEEPPAPAPEPSNSAQAGLEYTSPEGPPQLFSQLFSRSPRLSLEELPTRTPFRSDTRRPVQQRHVFRRARKKSDAHPPAGPHPDPQPDLEYTPPPSEPMILAPEVPSLPGLFGPRSPRSSIYEPPAPVYQQRVFRRAPKESEAHLPGGVVETPMHTPPAPPPGRVRRRAVH